MEYLQDKAPDKRDIGASISELPHEKTNIEAVLFVCFVALRPKSTAMVRAGWSVHLTTLFLEQA